jgi:hypothetical protein
MHQPAQRRATDDIRKFSCLSSDRRRNSRLVHHRKLEVTRLGEDHGFFLTRSLAPE